jgi:hypothetical protein
MHSPYRLLMVRYLSCNEEASHCLPWKLFLSSLASDTSVPQRLRARQPCYRQLTRAVVIRNTRRARYTAVAVWPCGRCGEIQRSPSWRHVRGTCELQLQPEAGATRQSTVTHARLHGETSPAVVWAGWCTMIQRGQLAGLTYTATHWFVPYPGGSIGAKLLAITRLFVFDCLMNPRLYACSVVLP